VTWVTTNFLRNGATVTKITEGIQGLELAIAKRLAREGARGIIVYRSKCEQGRGAASVDSLGRECLVVKADVSVPEDSYRLVATPLERFGSVNGLVQVDVPARRVSNTL
jgi:NAD(P)-dependent dehydrogenase (short-subunit alcohol dehydrogenase family)